MFCQSAIRSLIVLAPAKLNLFLRVLRRRDDGFHDLETVMTSINIYDTLQFEEIESDSIDLKVIMSPSRNAHWIAPEQITAGPKNLVIRAAELLRDYAGVQRGARITLIKRIPSAAGMGGGSSDAAATLGGLSRLWNLGLSRAELLTLAAKLGSDIGFFLEGSSIAACRGRGELTEPLTAPTSLHFVIARPASGLSTPAVFKQCQPGRTSRGMEEFARSLTSADHRQMVRLLLNDLQPAAENLNDEVMRLRLLFDTLPVLGHQMSGSGTSYFGVCHSSRHARAMSARLKAAGVPWVHVARSC